MITLTVTAADGAKTTVALADPVVSGGTTGTVLDARNFAGGTHAGTLADPWPATAIVAALKALPQPAGGTVMVADGIWLCTTQNLINVSNYILKGNSLNAVLRFTSPNTNVSSFWFQPGGNQNATITGLTIDANNLAMGNTSPIRISNPRNFNLTNNKFLYHPNGSIPILFTEGGNDVLVQGNTVVGGPGGGDMFQFQSLGGTLDTRFTITGNTISDSSLVIIGLDECKVTNNTIYNTPVTGGMCSIMVCGKWNVASKNNVVDGNTVDCTRYPGKESSAYIGGLPNDPGGQSPIDGFTITNNIVKGTNAYIAAQSMDNSSYTGTGLTGNIKKNVTISGNKLTSIWNGNTKIDLRGGAGSVDHVLVQNNTLVSNGGPCTIVGDAHTTNVTVLNQPGVTIVGFTPLSG